MARKPKKTDKASAPQPSPQPSPQSPKAPTSRRPLASAAPAPAITRANRIKCIYTICRRRLEFRLGDRVTYFPPARFDGDANRESEWDLLAHWCDEHKINPETLVKVVLDYRVRNEKVAIQEPRDLRSARHLTVVKTAIENEIDYMRRRLTIENNAMRTRIVSNQVSGLGKDLSYSDAILNPNINASALYRYCLARSLGDEYKGVAEHYEAPAIEQYTEWPDEYDLVWRHMLPEGCGVIFRRAWDEQLADLLRAWTAERRPSGFTVL